MILIKIKYNYTDYNKIIVKIILILNYNRKNLCIYYRNSIENVYVIQNYNVMNKHIIVNVIFKYVKYTKLIK